MTCKELSKTEWLDSCQKGFRFICTYEHFFFYWKTVVSYWLEPDVYCHIKILQWALKAAKRKQLHAWISLDVCCLWKINDWAQSYCMWEQRGTVSYSCINTKSADVKVLLTSSIFLPGPSRPPRHNAPDLIQLYRVKGVESGVSSQAASSRTLELMRVKRSVSVTTNMHQKSASHMPTKQHYLSAHRQPRLENILSALQPWRQISPLIAHFKACRIKGHTANRILSGGGGSETGIMNHATWYCLIECRKSKLDFH